MSIKAAIKSISSILGQRLSTSKSDLINHGRSESYFATMPPDAVAYPETTQEVSEIVKICAAQNCPVIGWGTGTSLEGQTQAVNGGICVDFSRMNQIIAINSADMDVIVQPGLTREALNLELRATGLFFPVDPGANASLGGMASTRASGTTAVRYGTMRDNVIGLTVVLASGEIIHTGTRAKKSSSGYDLTALFVGAEGTLGLICDITLRLHGQPESISAAVCAFDTIDAAVTCVIETIQIGIPMARIEFVDAATVKAVNAYSGSDMIESPHLMVEFHGSPSAVAEQAALFGDIVETHSGHGFEWAEKPEDRTALWAMRHNAYHAIVAARTGTRALVTDICVPISRLAEAVADVRQDLEKAGVSGPILGHVGDGNFHSILLFDPNNQQELEQVKSLSERMVTRALEMGGTATGEHGIGVGKLGYMDREHGAAWGVMGTLKHALDPQNIMNPGKLVPPRD